MAKRKIDPKELRLVVSAEDTKHEGRRMRVGAEMHIARYTVKGKLIRGCDGYHYPTGLAGTGYFSYPFMAWLLDNTPKVCRKCAKHTLDNLKPDSVDPPDWDSILRWADPQARLVR